MPPRNRGKRGGNGGAGGGSGRGGSGGGGSGGGGGGGGSGNGSRNGAGPSGGSGSNSRGPGNSNRNSSKQQSEKSNSRKSAKNSERSSQTQQHRRLPKQMVVPAPENEDPSTICSVCANKADDWAIGPCRHNVCGDCSHRMRVLYNRTTCVMCSQPQEEVAVVPLSKWQDSITYEDAIALPGAFLDEEVGMWFLDRARFVQLQQVRGWKSSKSGKVFANANQLRAHARNDHNSIYCEICFTGKKCFVSELPLYPLDPGRNHSSTLRAHLRKQHPMCRFCNKYFLDDDALYAHLQEAHETCSICERNGRSHEYFRSFEQLEEHYHKEHYACPEDGCRGVVFATKIELQTHLHSCRNGSRTRGGPRSRALRVNLQELHGANDPRNPSRNSDADVERERERQAARRRAFLSSQVVFTGALNLDDEPPDIDAPAPPPAAPPPTSSRSAASSSSAATAAGSSSQRDASEGVARALAQEDPAANSDPAPARPQPRPDDGKFHPIPMPKTLTESQARNTALVKRMRGSLDPGAYEDFKMASSLFREGKSSADEFFDAAVDTFGVRSAVRDILPELVALMPSPLLREPLLQTCLKRTDTELADLGMLDPDVSAAGAARPRREEDHFPTLNGAPAPAASASAASSSGKSRRFGAPGPEEFPRLGRVNRTANASGAAGAAGAVGAASSASSTTIPNGGASSSAASAATASSAASAVPAVPTRRTPAQQPKTAAAILREQAPTSRIFGNRVAGAPAGSSRAGGVNLQASAFPSLPTGTSAATPAPASRASASRAGPSSAAAAFPSLAPAAPAAPKPAPRRGPAPLSSAAFPSLGGSTSVRQAEPTPEPLQAPPPADVNLRAGAVWGGPSQGRSGKKRGPGQGRGRRPATPPRAAVLVSPLSDMPDVRGAMDAAGSNNAASNGSSSGRRGGGGKTIDVTEIARDRRKAIAQSSLPKVGGSGYGFAWERKKAMQKRREIRSEASTKTERLVQREAGGVSVTLAGNGGARGGGGNTGNSRNGLTTAAGDNESAVASVVALSGSDENRNDEAAAAADAGQGDETEQPEQADLTGENFDPYSFLKSGADDVDAPYDDAVSAFLGGSGH